MGSLTKDQFVSLTRSLLEKERTAEIEETRILHENLPAKELQRRGVCLLGLNISSRKTGYYGRILVAFDTDKEALPSHSITPGCGRGTRRGQKSTVDEQSALLKTLVRGETVNFVDETKSEMEGQVLIVDKFQKSVTVSVEDGMMTRRIPVNSLLVRSDDIADSEQAPKKIRKERPKRRGQAQQNRQEENIDYETVEERSETPLQEDSSSLLQEPLRNQHLPMVFSCGTLIQTGHTYSIKGFNSVTVAATEIVSTPNSTCKLKGDLILNGHIDHVVKIEMPVERAQSASCPLGKKDREFLGVLSLFNRQNQEELRNSDVSVRRRVREAQLGAALHREVQCALKCRNFKRRFSLGLCSFEHDLDILNLDAVSKTREISYRNENFEGFDSLLGNHWDVLPVEEQQHFRFVTRLTLKAKGMQIVGSVYTAVCRCSFGPDYRALVKSRELTVDAGEVSDLDEEDTGDIVGLSPTTADKATDELHSGIVTHVGQSALSVAFDDSQDLFSLADDQKYKLTKLANDVTYKRLRRALDNLESSLSGPASYLCSVLFGDQPVSEPLILNDIVCANESLDDSQKEAVRFALSQKELGVIHGPPGTGKTTTVIEIILQCVRRGDKILACAPSNIAVDNLVERLVNSKHKVVRIGHPARVLPHIQKYSLDAILSASDESKLVDDVRRDIDNALVELRIVHDSGRRRKIKEDLKFWRKELRERSNAATKAILQRADVVLVTLTSATEDGPIRFLEENHFDMVVIDEVSQALEAACWIPLLRTSKCVLAGDHHQLPPTILSKEAAKKGLERTLMERVIGIHGDKIVRMLTTQYRMNHKIMQWSSDQLYQSRLVAHHSVENHLLIDMPGIQDTDDTTQPLLLIDTAGCDLHELDLPEEISKGNEGEASIVVSHVKTLVETGIKPVDIAVIAPYNLQVDLIRAQLSSEIPGVEVKTVDGFQGREKEAVVISLVRSNEKGEVGFLSEKRRINVAVTRARRHLAMIGDSETVSNDKFLKSLMDYVNKEGEVRSAQELVNDGLVFQSVSRPDHLDDLLSASKQRSDRGARPKVPKQIKKKDPRQKPAEFTKDDRNKALERAEATKSRLEELQTELNDFIANEKSDLLVFPCTLNSHDRLLVHELAEKMGLAHISKGVDRERHIEVSKPGKSVSQENQSEGDSLSSVSQSEQFLHRPEDQSKKVAQRKIDNQPPKENDGNVIDTTNVKSAQPRSVDISEVKVKDPGKDACRWCGKNIIKANVQLHELGCPQNPHKKQRPCSASSKKQEPFSKSSAPRRFDKELAKKVNSVDSDDIDALIATVQKMDKFCCFKKCKTSVQTLCNVCNFCQGRYCMSHHMPEIHGCGDAARAEARARISKDGVLYRGSGVPSKKSDEAKKAHLQKKLDNKLTEMSAKRKMKQKK